MSVIQCLWDVRFLRWLSMFSVSLWLSCGLTLRIAFTQPLCRSSRGKNDCLQLWYWISSSGPSLLTPPSRLFTFLFFIFRFIVSMTLTLMTPSRGGLKPHSNYLICMRTFSGKTTRQSEFCLPPMMIRHLKIGERDPGNLFRFLPWTQRSSRVCHSLLLCLWHTHSSNITW